MTTSDTPETDEAVIASGGDWSPVLRAVAQRLERERDAAMQELKNIQGAYEDATNYYARIIELIDERDALKTAIRETLEENRHLADGNDCTLRKLKSAVSKWK